MEVRELLRQVADGEVSPDDATDRLAAGPLSGAGLAGINDLGFARLDTHRGLAYRRPRSRLWQRENRRPRRSPSSSSPAGRRQFPTDPGHPRRSPRSVGDCSLVEWPARDLSKAPPSSIGRAAGRRKRPGRGAVGRHLRRVRWHAEAALTAQVFGAERGAHLTDVGVAGLHRVLAAREEFAEADCADRRGRDGGGASQRRRWPGGTSR